MREQVRARWPRRAGEQGERGGPTAGAPEGSRGGLVAAQRAGFPAVQPTSVLAPRRTSSTPGLWAGLALLQAGLSAVLVGSLAGCAAGPRMSPATPRPPAAEAPEPEPSTVEEATLQLDRGASHLERALAPKGDATVGVEPGAGAGVPPSQPQQPPAPPPAQPAGGGEARPQQAQEERWREPCTEACRALASMRRAAETICRLAGPEDARCQGARRRVQEGEGRASPCGC